jgi:hypothetical protein
MRNPLAALAIIVALAGLPRECGAQAARTELGIKETSFTLNGRPTFLLGVSYYAGLGASEEALKRDLDGMQGYGFNWLRVWATWGAFQGDVSAVDAAGKPREAFLGKLKALVAECDRRGMVVDVSFSRENGLTGPPRFQTLETHRPAVETIVAALKEHRNWYLDVSNERNLKGKVHAPFGDVKELRDAARRLDAALLVTASHAGDITREELREYLATGIDFISPHRPRDAASPGQTAARCRELIEWMKEAGRVLPVHYQEPFRRGFGKWNPKAEDFVADLKGARESGAAGWCFHNGDERARPDGRPRRSFDLREKGLFEQLDEEERGFLRTLRP